MRRPILLAILLALGSPATAQAPHSLTLDGQAHTGADQRSVRFVFLCSANRGPNIHGVLGLQLDIPDHETLRRVFDFDAFEGPDARAGRLTRIESSANGSTATLRAMASGAAGAGADLPFGFGINAARRGDAAGLREVRRILAPLVTGAAQLVWTQGNTRAGGPPIIARLDVTAEDSARLRALLAPCLAP